MEKLRDDFKIIYASVKKIDKNEIVIDKGESDGIKKGDYFQVVKKGNPFTDPDTQEIIGYVKDKQAIIQVREVRKDESVATIVSGEGPFFSGQRIVRFSGVDTTFVGDNINLEKKLKMTIPELNWLPAGYNSLLKFIKKGDTLFVYDAKSQKIREYVLSPETDIGKTPEGERGFTIKKITNLEKKLNLRDLADISHNILGFEIDKMGERIFFLNHDGLYMQPYRKKGDAQLIYPIQGPYKPLSLNLSDDGNYIALNLSLGDMGFKSVIFKNEEKVIPLRRDINMYLYFSGNFLFGQALEKNRRPASDLYKMNISRNDINYISEVDVPDNFNLKYACILENKNIIKDNFIYIFFHNNKIFLKIGEKTDLFPYYIGDTLEISLSCIRDDTEKGIIISTNRDILVLYYSDNENKISRINLFGEDENRNILSIKKIQGELILGIRERDYKNNSEKTTLKYISLEDFKSGIFP